MSLEKSDILTTRYGGIIPIVKEMIKRGLPELIDAAFNADKPRAKQCKYKFSDMFMSWICASLCGATRIENVTGLKEDLEVIPGLNFPSHDTVARLMKEVVSNVEKEDRISQTAATLNEWDDNIKLNRLLIQVSKKMGALKEGQEYILDVDCTFITTKCVNAQKSAQIDRQGFNPMICLIGNLPVFISMRNGNSGADFRQLECVRECLDILESEGIKVKMVRTDGAGYRELYTQMLHDRNIQFLTASPVNAAYKSMFKKFNAANWKDVTIETAVEFKDCQIAEINYSMTNLDSEWRVIALRVPNKHKFKLKETQEEREFREAHELRMQSLEKRNKLKSHQKKYQDAKWNNIEEYNYKMITTNDFETPAEELFYLYNQRGDAERKFSFMKQDFGWKYPPFQNLAENTVFMIISAMANNVFRGIAEIFEGTNNEIKLNARVRKFQKAFIDAVALCLDGQWTIKGKIIDDAKNS